MGDTTEPSDSLYMIGPGGNREPVYWRSRGEGDHLEFASTGQPHPPGVIVLVDRHGIRVMRMRQPASRKPGMLMPNVGAARWLANRLMEACAIYEQNFGSQVTFSDGG